MIPPVPLTARTTAAALELPLKSLRLIASLTTYPVPGLKIPVIADKPKRAVPVAPEPPPP